MRNASNLSLTTAEQGFVYTSVPTRVVFGFGTRNQLGEELRRLGIRRPLVLFTPRAAPLVRELVREVGIEIAGEFDGAVMHTPVPVTEKALVVTADSGADGLI